MGRVGACLAGMLMLAQAGGFAEETPEPPALAEHLRLVVVGGPPRGDLEVTLNGEFVVEIGDEPNLFHEIADLVKPGVNELTVTLKPSSTPREYAEDLRLDIRLVRESGRTMRAVGSPLAEVVVPADAGEDEACTETARFRVGEVPKAEGEPLKNDYWLFVTGPPARSRVSVFVNDHLAYEASSGNEFIKITPLVRKGKNTVTFESRPTCLVPKSGRSGYLTFSVAPAEVEVETVKMTTPPEVEMQFDPKKKGETLTVRRTFRGR